MHTIYLSTDGTFLNDYVNITVIPDQLNQIFSLPIAKDSIDIVRISNLFRVLPVYDSCYLLYVVRNWLRQDGVLIIEGYGSLGNGIPIILFHLLHECGFLIGNYSSAKRPPEAGGFRASPYSKEMPIALLLSRIMKFLYICSESSNKSGQDSPQNYADLFSNRLRL